MTAGADVITSNTNTPLPLQLEFEHELEQSEILDGLRTGKLMFTRRASGILKIEQDINSLHVFTPTKNREFRKNKIIRINDEVGTTVRRSWEDIFMGNTPNNEEGRLHYKSQIDTYFINLQKLGALQNHAIQNLRIEQGDDLDTVLMDIGYQPVDVMERLFMTANVATTQAILLSFASR